MNKCTTEALPVSNIIDMTCKPQWDLKQIQFKKK